jgi:hypothetical protein
VSLGKGLGIARTAGNMFEVRRVDNLDVWMIFDDSGELAHGPESPALNILREDLTQFPPDLFSADRADAA